MEEAQRLLTVSVWKLYRCRLRRGGLRLHRSLQLSLLVRAARHRYLSARAAAETLPGPPLAGDTACGETPERGEPPSDPTGDPRNAQPNRPTGEQPNRPTEDPRTDQKCPPGNPLRDWSGEPPNQPVGALRSEWDRSCPPSPPTEDPPSAPTGDRLAPRTPDPADRDRDPPERCPCCSPVPRSPPGRAEAAQQRLGGAGAGAGTEQTGAAGGRGAAAASGAARALLGAAGSRFRLPGPRRRGVLSPPGTPGHTELNGDPPGHAELNGDPLGHTELVLELPGPRGTGMGTPQTGTGTPPGHTEVDRGPELDGDPGGTHGSGQGSPKLVRGPP